MLLTLGLRVVEALERRALTDDHNIAQLLRQFVLLLLVGSVDLFADLDIKVISGHVCSCRGCDALSGALTGELTGAAGQAHHVLAERQEGAQTLRPRLVSAT